MSMRETNTSNLFNHHMNKLLHKAVALGVPRTCILNWRLSKSFNMIYNHINDKHKQTNTMNQFKFHVKIWRYLLVQHQTIARLIDFHNIPM